MAVPARDLRTHALCCSFASHDCGQSWEAQGGAVVHVVLTIVVHYDKTPHLLDMLCGGPILEPVVELSPNLQRIPPRSLHCDTEMES